METVASIVQQMYITLGSKYIKTHSNGQIRYEWLILSQPRDFLGEEDIGNVDDANPIIYIPGKEKCNSVVTVEHFNTFYSSIMDIGDEAVGELLFPTYLLCKEINDR